MNLQTLQMKVAELGGDNIDDNAFEDAFASIAHAFIEKNAPKLLDYEVGFQLIRRDPDKNRAAAVVAFKIGKRWLLAPMFFIGGRLRGAELLYDKSRDKIVPLKENYINAFISKRPTPTGNNVSRNLREQGVRAPDFARGMLSPYKYASTKLKWEPEEFAALEKRAEEIGQKSGLAGTPAFDALEPWAKVATADLARVMTREIPAYKLGLPGLIKAGGAPVLQHLTEMFDRYPVIAKAAAEIYGESLLEAAAAHTPPKVQPSRTPETLKRALHSVLGKTASHNGLEIFRLDTTPLHRVALLPDDEKQTLLLTGQLIKDARIDDHVADAVIPPTPAAMAEELQLSNPAETGIYTILDVELKPHTCLVVTSPYAASPHTPYNMVVTLEGDKQALLAHPRRIFSTKLHNTRLNKLYDELPKATSLTPGDGYYVLLNKTGHATVPFRVIRSRGTSAGTKLYDVNYVSPGLLTSSPDSTSTRKDFNDFLSSGILRLDDRRTSEFRRNGPELAVPSDAYLIKVSDPYEPDRFKFASPESISRMVAGEGYPIQIKKAHRNYIVDERERSYGDAILHLVVNHNLRESTAIGLLSKVANAGDTVNARVWKKHASIYNEGGFERIGPYETGHGTSTPTIPDPVYSVDGYPGNEIMRQEPQETRLSVPDLAIPYSSRDQMRQMPPPEPSLMRMTQDAAQSGQKEIVDASAVGSILRAVGDTRLIDEHVDVLMDAVNALGHLDIAAIWHIDRFEDRYGKANARNIADAIVNNFETVGDLALELKLQTIEADPTAEAMDNDIDES